MNLVKPSFEEINYENPIEHGEYCTRVCYKSEALIKKGSAVKLINGIASAGHTAMLEHIPVYFTVDTIVACAKYGKIIRSPYTKLRKDINRMTLYVSTNLRVIFENDKTMYNHFMEQEGKPYRDAELAVEFCSFNEYPDKFVRRITIKFIMDRIGSQSFCRHRLFSFAQESTRWCNYLKDKFGSEISISEPSWLKEEDKTEFIEDMKVFEEMYFKWINKGYKAEEARYFLPFGLKTEIIMTGFPDAWQHFFELRNESHAHIQAQELAKPLQEYFIEKNYI